jgi:hypothetical protein
MRVSGQRHAPAVSPPEKDRVSNVQEAAWTPRLVWTIAENLAPSRIRSLKRPARSESLSDYAVTAPLIISFVSRSGCKISV